MKIEDLLRVTSASGTLKPEQTLWFGRSLIKQSKVLNSIGVTFMGNGPGTNRAKLKCELRYCNSEYHGSVMTDLVGAAARDLDELLIRGDRAHEDSFLSEIDGLVKLARRVDSHQYDPKTELCWYPGDAEGEPENAVLLPDLEGFALYANDTASEILLEIGAIHLHFGMDIAARANIVVVTFDVALSASSKANLVKVPVDQPAKPVSPGWRISLNDEAVV